MINRSSFILLFTLISMLPGCSLSEQELKSGSWKYGEGYHFGDMIDFKKDFSIRSDTIFYQGREIGIITRRTTGFFGNDNQIEIASLKEKKTGRYHQK